MSRHFISFAILLLVVGCGGGGGGGGASPAPAPPTGSNPPVIQSFSPSSGAVSTEVTLIGLEFASTPAGNTVSFNGVAANVLSASTTSLVATVPAGASTGRVQVSTSGGSATSSNDFTVVTGLGAAWTTRLSGPRGRPDALVWNGTRFISAGYSGDVQTSTDMLNWRLTGSSFGATDIAWNGSLMVAVGGSLETTIKTSPDGLTWTSRSLPAGSTVLPRAVAFSPTAWVAVGNGGTIYSSPDAITWTARASGITTNNLTALTWTGNQFVAVGANGTVVTSPDGTSWTLQTPPTTDSFTAIGSSASLIVASTNLPNFTGNPGALMTSTDGINWTPGPTGLGLFNRVTYAGGRFVAVGWYRAATSTNGINWTGNSSVPGILNSITHTGSHYVANGTTSNSSGAVFSSIDGLGWSTRTADQALLAVARRPSDGLLAVAGWNVARTSSDAGVSWNLNVEIPLHNTYYFHDMLWSPAANAFIGLVQSAANCFTRQSVDGRVWSTPIDAPCANLSGGGLAISNNSVLLAIGSSALDPPISTSADNGVTWTARTPPTGLVLRKGFWTGNQFVAVGDNGALATSPDGVTWTPRISGATSGLNGAAASTSTLVVVGDNGTILRSSDGGVSWTARAHPTNSRVNLRRVRWTGSEFIVVAGISPLLRSADGVTWSVQETPYMFTSSFNDNYFALNDIAWLPDGGGRLMLIGENGLIATSP